LGCTSFSYVLLLGTKHVWRVEEKKHLCENHLSAARCHS